MRAFLQKNMLEDPETTPETQLAAVTTLVHTTTNDGGIYQVRLVLWIRVDHMVQRVQPALQHYNKYTPRRTSCKASVGLQIR